MAFGCTALLHLVAFRISRAMDGLLDVRVVRAVVDRVYRYAPIGGTTDTEAEVVQKRVLSELFSWGRARLQSAFNLYLVEL